MFFSILFKMKPMVLTKILKLRLNHEHPCLLFNRSDRASDSWGGLACGNRHLRLLVGLACDSNRSFSTVWPQ